MNILFLSQRIPYPPNRGDKIRSFHIIKHLSKNHSVSVACLIQSKREIEYVEPLREYCASVNAVLLKPLHSKVKSLISLPERKPLTLSYFHSRELQNVVNKLIAEGRFDLLFVYSSSMAQYALKFEDVRRILDLVDIDSDKWLQYSRYTRFPKSLIYRLEGNRLRRYEAVLVKQFDHCIVVSEIEEKLLKTFAPHAAVSVISNGVDFEFFKPRSEEYEPYSLVFTGVMDYYANVDGVLYFHKQILPLIRKEIPQVRFYIVGSNPTKEIQALGQEKNIIVTGYVRDVREYLDKAAVCVVPLRIARGIQNKILEAMSMGLPVVTTPKAFEGINAEPGRDLFVEDTPSKFAQRVTELLRDKELRDRIARNARQLILERYDWNRCLARLDQIVG